MGEKNPTKDLLENLKTQSEQSSGEQKMIEVQLDSQKYGPFLLEDVLAAFQSRAIHSTDAEARVLGEKAWYPLLSHPEISKIHTPKLDQLNVEEAFLVLSEGKKSGPFNKEQVIEKLKNKDILFTDYISFDHGFTWSHIYNIVELNKHNKRDEEDLPPPPAKDIHSKEIHTGEKEDYDTFIDLLNIGKNTDHSSSKSSNQKNQEASSEDNLDSKKGYITTILIIAGFLYAIYFTTSFIAKNDKTVARSESTSERKTNSKTIQKPFIKAEMPVKKYGEKPSRFESKSNRKSSSEAKSSLNEQREEDEMDTPQEEETVDPYDEIVKESEREAAKMDKEESSDEEKEDKAGKKIINKDENVLDNPYQDEEY